MEVQPTPAAAGPPGWMSAAEAVPAAGPGLSSFGLALARATVAPQAGGALGGAAGLQAGAEAVGVAAAAAEGLSAEGGGSFPADLPAPPLPAATPQTSAPPPLTPPSLMLGTSNQPAPTQAKAQTPQAAIPPALAEATSADGVPSTADAPPQLPAPLPAPPPLHPLAHPLATPPLTLAEASVPPVTAPAPLDAPMAGPEGPDAAAGDTGASLAQPDAGSDEASRPAAEAMPGPAAFAPPPTSFAAPAPVQGGGADLSAAPGHPDAAPLAEAGSATLAVVAPGPWSFPSEPRAPASAGRQGSEAASMDRPDAEAAPDEAGNPFARATGPDTGTTGPGSHGAPATAAAPAEARAPVPPPVPVEFRGAEGLAAPGGGMTPAASAGPVLEVATPASPPPPVRQVAQVAVALAFAPALGQFRLALEPAELGRVEIMVRRAGDAHLVQVMAERPETLALLQRDRAELDRALAQSGVVVEEGGIGFSLTPREDPGTGRQGGQGGSQGGETWRYSGAPSPGTTPRESRPTARGLLDLNI